MIFLMEIQSTGWEGSTTNTALSTSPCTKPNWLWQGSWGLGGSSCLITTGNGPEFNVPFAFTTKLPKELKATWICYALSLKLFFPGQPVQPGLSQTTRHGHCLQVVWHSDTKFWSYKTFDWVFASIHVKLIPDVSQSFTFKDMSNSKNKGTNLAVKVK